MNTHIGKPLHLAARNAQENSEDMTSFEWVEYDSVIAMELVVRNECCGKDGSHPQLSFLFFFWLYKPEVMPLQPCSSLR